MTEETMGKRIAAHRKGMNLTQDALAEKLGVTAQAVSKWENDLSCPDIAMLPKLAQLFGITVDALLGVEQPEKKQPCPAAVVPGREENPKEDGWKMEWNAGRSGSIVLAVWVLLTGGLLLVSNMQGRGADLWDLLWSSALVVFGGYAMLRRFTVLRLSCVLFGVHCILSEMHMAPCFIRRNMLLPLLLLLFGLSLLMEAFRRPKKHSFRFVHNGKKQISTLDTEGEWFRCSTSFGENHRNISLPKLSSGEASVNFGELKVDLSGCGEIADGCILTGSCAFGELEFLVPARYRVEPNVSTAFGVLNVVGEPVADPIAVLRLEGSARFGEIKIKYI